MEMADWVDNETKGANFGDKRLKKRFGSLLNKLVACPDKSIPGSCKTWKETLAAYRFFNHKNITSFSILKSHQEATVERIKNEKIVLIPQDTTEIDFTGRKPLEGMGYLGHEKSHGFYLHPSLAITPNRLCLGIIDLETWTRKELGIRHKRKNKPIEEKETYRWLKGYEAANKIALAAPNTLIVSISDREGDIYEMLEKIPSETNKAFWLIRSQMNRKTINPLEDKGLKLWEGVRASQSLGKIEFKLPSGKIYDRRITHKRHLRKERLVLQEVRISTVYLNPPQRKEKKLSPVRINVVHCVEINPPSDQDKIEWFLLTSFPVNDVKTAINIVKWYLCRWQIEIFFKILKSGCTVEKLQFENLKATTNCISLYMIIAWRILYLTMLGRAYPDRGCHYVFEDDEWQALYVISTKKPPPTTPPKIGELILMIAKLGGFLGRKSDGEPGPKAMWVGMQKMKDFTLAWKTFHSLPPKQTYV